MKTPDQLIEDVVKKEGGYVNNPNDTGGATNFGITEKVARAHGYNGNMRDLPLAKAKAIYQADYWDTPRFNEIYKFAPNVAAEMLDMGVNMGPSIPAKAFQRALNALNKQETLYPDLIVDGQLGARSINALQTYLSKRGAKSDSVLLKILICYRGNRYLELTENRKQNEEFLFGWIANRIELVE